MPADGRHFAYADISKEGAMADVTAMAPFCFIEAVMGS